MPQWRRAAFAHALGSQAPGACQACPVRCVVIMAAIAHREGGGESDAPRGVDVAPSGHCVSRLSLHDRLLDWRDSILANPRFQRFAGNFALTRPIARRRASELFDLCAGFVYSQVLFACVRLKLFDQLANGPLSSAELASLMPLPADATVLLLDAAVSLQLLQRRSDGRYGLGSLGAALLGNPGVIAMIEHHAMLYSDLKDPIALLRGDVGAGQLAAYDFPAGAVGLFVPRTSLPARYRWRRRLLHCGDCCAKPDTALRVVRFARSRRPGERTVSFRR